MHVSVPYPLAHMFDYLHCDWHLQTMAIWRQKQVIVEQIAATCMAVLCIDLSGIGCFVESGLMGTWVSVRLP